MFDNLLDLVKQHAGDAIVNNPDIPNDQNNAVIETAASSILSNLQNQASSGGIGNILSMFTGNSGGVSNSVATGVASSLMEKFGMDSSKAQGIAAMLVPLVLNKLVNKTNDPNDSSFNLNGILGALTGGKTEGTDINNMLNQLKGNDGQFSLDDITNLFK